jgi:O-antigen/teichoic acid export membrane protein
MAAVVLMLISQDLVLLLLGRAWAGTGKILMVLAPGIAATLLSGTSAWLHLSLGTPGRWLRWNIVACVVTIAAFVVALPYGAVAMGIAYTTKTYVLLLPGLFYAGYPIRLNPKALFRSIWPYFVSAFFIAVLWLWISNHWMPFDSGLSNARLVAKIFMVACASSILYVLFVVAIERNLQSVQNIVSLAKLAFKRR